jgi:hypothetical protein
VAELVGDVLHDFGRRVLGVVQEGAQKPHGAELDGVAELRLRAPAGHRPPPRFAVQEEVAGQLPVIRYGGERTVVAAPPSLHHGGRNTPARILWIPRGVR